MASIVVENVVPDPPPKKYIITLDEKEAVALRTIMGCFPTPSKQNCPSLYTLLRDAGVKEDTTLGNKIRHQRIDSFPQTCL